MPENHKFRVLRGGAFWSAHQSVRYAARDGLTARVVDRGVGFRVVARRKEDRGKRSDLFRLSRVLRSGAFWDDPWGVCCTYRGECSVYSVLNVVGFRIVARREISNVNK